MLPDEYTSSEKALDRISQVLDEHGIEMVEEARSFDAAGDLDDDDDEASARKRRDGRGTSAGRRRPCRLGRAHRVVRRFRGRAGLATGAGRRDGRGGLCGTMDPVDVAPAPARPDNRREVSR
jgi:hypothetical protein